LTSRRGLLAALLAGSLGPPAVACGLPNSTGIGPLVPGDGHDPPSRPAASATGRLLFVADADIWVWERGQARRLTHDRVSRQPVWSPDGKRIAHVKIDVNSSELWVMDADSANSRQLTDNYNAVLVRNNWAFRPAWWPDGSRLLYLSEETTNDLMVWQIGLDKRGRRPFVTVPDFEGGLDMPGVAPDARRLLLVSYRTPGARAQLFTFTLPGGPFRQLTDHPDGAYDPAWSPDGTRIAYTVRHAGRHDVWAMTADGSVAEPLTDAGVCRAPCWSPDGQQIAYASAESGAFDIWVAPAPALGARTDAPAATQPAPPAQPSPASPAVPEPVPRPAPGKPLTAGLGLDAVSGISWTR
jgi:TolB protein